MSVWINTADRMPPLHEEVLILYKDRKDKLTEDNLYYGIARRVMWNPFNSKDGGVEEWSRFIEYQGYYEVVYWTPLIDMPHIHKEQNNES